MEDWENEPAPLVLKKEQPKSMWDDEDADENDVKDSWEDDDESAPPPVVEPPKEKAPKKAAAKSTDKKGIAVEVVPEEPLDPVAEKLRQQRVDKMDSQIETLEGRLKSFLVQLQTEYGVLQRMVYKNKNQHRRCSYFRYLLKVRSDLRLLQSTQLEELVNSSFLVINGDRAKQKVQLLESLKRRKRDGGKHNFLERLHGAARLLSQMVEPMLKASMEISILLARSFFVGFCTTILALLARFRVLVQQILLDVVSVFNMTSSLSQKEQSIKLAQQGFEVFREYYPTNERAVYLECVWETDKYRLLERISEPEHKSQDMHKVEEISRQSSTIQYQRIETLLGDDESEKGVANKTSEENHGNINPEPSKDEVDNCKLVEDGWQERGSSTAEDSLHTSSSPQSNPPKSQSGVKSKVAFIKVKKPAASTNERGLQIKPTENNSGDKEDIFFNLLTGGIVKNSFL